MASVFHSMSAAALLVQLNAGTIVVGDLYYTTDTQQLYIACTNTNGGAGIAPTNLILTGAITLGFDGNAASIGGFPIVGTPAHGQVLVFNGSAWVPADETGGISNFNELGGGTNTSAAMVVGSGASLEPAGSGVIDATKINGVPITGTPDLGKIPIGQGDGTAVFADPLVQGIQADDTVVSTINPVLISAEGGDAKQHNVSPTNPLPTSLPAATVTTLTPPTASAIGAAVAAPSASAIGAAVAAPSASAIASAIVSNPPTVGIASGTITTLTPPSASAVASAIVANPPTVGITSGTVTTLTPPSASAIGTAVAAPSASAIASAIVSNPPTVGIASGTITTLTPPSASAIASAIVSNPPTVVIGSATPKGFHISSNAVQAIKASAGVLFGYFLDNTANSATSYFQFFNVASGSVSLGSTASLFVIPVPAGLAANLAMSGGWTFSTAMSFAATTAYNGSTAPGSAVDCTIVIV